MSGKQEWVKKCLAILKMVRTHKHGWIFLEPVDPVKLQLHDYFEVIKNPMDLGTIKTRLENGQITNPETFKEDTLLTFQNAMKYNPPTNDVHIMAKTLEDYFHSKWDHQEAAVMEKWRAETTGGGGGGGMDAAGGGDAASTGKRVHEHDFSDDRPMSYEEKRELSANMNKLPGKKLGSVVQIIHDRNPKILQQNAEDPDEIEIDIDKIDAATLRYLDSFVKEALAKNKKKKSA